MTNIHVTTPPTAISKWHDTVDQTRSQSVKKFAFLRKTPMVSQEQVHAARSNFKNFFGASVTKIGSDLHLSEHQKAQLKTKGNEAYGRIFHNALARKGGSSEKMTKAEFNNMVKTANVKAQQEIIKLTKEFATPRLAPQIIPFKSGGGMKFTVMKPAPQFENLVLRGGGAKGIGNGAALIEMERSGALSGLKHIVGTSAGALTAVGLACGMTAVEFDKFASETDIGGLKQSPKNFATVYPMVNMGLRVGYTAGNALKKLDEASSTQVHERLSNDKNWSKVETALNDGIIDKAQYDRLTTLKEKPDLEKSRVDKMVTFNDLRVLSKIFPGEVKELTLTGMNRTDQELTYFNADDTPNMPIAVAGRISMSIPFYFASVSYDAGKGEKTWVDGGVGSNMPSGAVLDELRKNVDDARKELENATGGEVQIATNRLKLAQEELEKVQSRTLLMTFDDKGAAYKKMHAPKEQPKVATTKFQRFKQGVKNSKDKLIGNIAGDEKWVQNKIKDTQNVYDSGPNVVVVHHGNIGTLDLDADEDRVNEATLESQMRVLERVVMHQNEATHQVFDSMDDVISSFSPQELRLIVQAGAPTLEQFQAIGRENMEAVALFNTANTLFERATDLVGNMI